MSPELRRAYEAYYIAFAVIVCALTTAISGCVYLGDAWFASFFALMLFLFMGFARGPSVAPEEKVSS